MLQSRSTACFRGLAAHFRQTARHLAAVPAAAALRRVCCVGRDAVARPLAARVAHAGQISTNAARPFVPMRSMTTFPPLTKGLAAIVKLDMFSQLNTDAIVQVWASFHAAKSDTVATTTAPHDWLIVKQRASECSLFALPLFQNEGYITMLCQFAGDSFVMVPLQAVKDEGEAAKPWLMVSYYDELVASKGVVLVRGVVMDDRMSKVECDVLMHLLHRQYSVDVAYAQVVQFTHHNDQVHPLLPVAASAACCCCNCCFTLTAAAV